MFCWFHCSSNNVNVPFNCDLKQANLSCCSHHVQVSGQLCREQTLDNPHCLRLFICERIRLITGLTTTTFEELCGKLFHNTAVILLHIQMKSPRSKRADAGKANCFETCVKDSPRRNKEIGRSRSGQRESKSGGGLCVSGFSGFRNKTNRSEVASGRQFLERGLDFLVTRQIIIIYWLIASARWNAWRTEGFRHILLGEPVPGRGLGATGGRLRCLTVISFLTFNFIHFRSEEVQVVGGRTVRACLSKVCSRRLKK